MPRDRADDQSDSRRGGARARVASARVASGAAWGVGRTGATASTRARRVADGRAARWNGCFAWACQPAAGPGAARLSDVLLRYWQTPTTPVPAGPVGVPHVPDIETLPTTPLQHGVPPPTQFVPLGRQQLHRTPLVELLQFVQQAPSVERQWP